MDFLQYNGYIEIFNKKTDMAELVSSDVENMDEIPILPSNDFIQTDHDNYKKKKSHSCPCYGELLKNSKKISEEYINDSIDKKSSKEMKNFLEEDELSINNDREIKKSSESIFIEINELNYLKIGKEFGLEDKMSIIIIIIVKLIYEKMKNIENELKIESIINNIRKQY